MGKWSVAEFMDRVNPGLDHPGFLGTRFLENQVAFSSVRDRFATKRAIDLGESFQSLIHVDIDIHNLFKTRERAEAGKAVSGGTNLQNRRTTRSKSGFLVLLYCITPARHSGAVLFGGFRFSPSICNKRTRNL
jgi:hypothetical protein